MNYDLVVIGSGPAGQKAAIAASKFGKSVAIIDRKSMIGGVSLHGGTIPSKTLREAVLYLSGMKQRIFYGKDYAVKEKISHKDLKDRVELVEKSEMEVVRNQLRRNNVDMYFGCAHFLDPHAIAVDADGKDRVTLHGDKILIACGTRPARDPGIPFDDRSIIDVNQILDLEKLPDELIVVGAGVIGLEYASMFAALNTEVTVIEKRTSLLDFVDTEIIERLVYHLRNLNVTFRLGETVARVQKDERDRVVVYLESGKKIRGQTLLYAVGRQTNADSLDLDVIGLETDKRGRIDVDEKFRTTIDHIYAAGDVIGFPALASTSTEQGRLASNYMFKKSASSSAKCLPYGIYTIPEISIIGKTEQELTREKTPYEFGAARFDELARGGILGVSLGYLKILFDPDSLKLLGVHIVGESATELIHIGQAVLSMDGTLEYFRDTVFNYPTLAEAYKVAALDGFNKL